MDRREMLKRVQMLEFVLIDVNLFLNTHPDCEAALNFYGKYQALHKQAVDEYEKNFGPITAAGVNVEEGWSWINNPWPWEMEG